MTELLQPSDDIVTDKPSNLNGEQSINPLICPPGTENQAECTQIDRNEVSDIATSSTFNASRKRSADISDDFESPKWKRISAGTRCHEDEDETLADSTSVGTASDKAPLEIKEEQPLDNSCPICFCDYETAGNHRVSSLACGHMFGYQCISKWIQSKPRKEARCPECNAPAKKSDIRKHFIKNIVCIDSAERARLKNEFEAKLDNVRKELDVEQMSKLTLDSKLTRSKNLIKQYQEEMLALSLELDKMKELVNSKDSQLSCFRDRLSSMETNSSLNSLESRNSEVETGRSNKITRDSIIKIGNPSKKARSFDYCSKINRLVIGCQNPDTDAETFYGFLCINTQDFNDRKFISNIHESQILDVRMCPSGNGLALSTADDGKLQVTNVMIGKIVHTIQLPGRARCCAWNIRNPNYLFVGMNRNHCLIFDLHGPSNPIKILENNSLMGQKFFPIHSLEYIYIEQLGFEALAVANFEGVFLWNSPCKDLAIQNESLFDSPVEEDQKQCTLFLKSPPQAQCFSLSINSDEQTDSSYLIAGFRKPNHSFYHVCNINNLTDHRMEFSWARFTSIMFKSCMIYLPCSDKSVKRRMLAIPDERRKAIRLIDTADSMKLTRLNANLSIESASGCAIKNSKTIHKSINFEENNAFSMPNTNQSQTMLVETHLMNENLMAIKSWTVSGSSFDKTFLAILTQTNLIIYSCK